MALGFLKQSFYIAFRYKFTKIAAQTQSKTPYFNPFKERESPPLPVKNFRASILEIKSIPSKP
jgi:hypothetical protein